MPNPKVCGAQALAWTDMDQYAAEIQAGVKQLDQRSQDEQLRHAQLRARLFDECQEEKSTAYLATIRVVMANARKWHRRPSVSNAQLMADLFGMDWKQAQSLCARLSIDPKGSNS